MTKEEANKVFKAWQNYMEIADKMDKIFNVVPESFLPYPINVLEEALNIVAKDYFDAGDHRRSKIIQETSAAYLTGYFLNPSQTKMTDEEALVSMKRSLDLILGNEELKKTKLSKLKESQESWLKLKD